jgi:Tetracyclin repressor-like, C-terminal domain
MPHFIAYSARNPAFGDAWRNMATEPPRQELRHLLKLGIKKGELSPKIDLDLSLALLLGPMIYWYIFLRKSGGNPKGLAEGVVDAFWKAFGMSSGAPKMQKRTQSSSFGKNATYPQARARIQRP